jgi:valyl-tRNA synthetase
VYLKCSDDESADILKSLEDLVIVLGSGQEVIVIRDEMPPSGCAISTVSAKCEVHMLLKVCASLPPL